MKILAIGDTADNVYTLKKFAKKIKIHLITFPRKQYGLLTNLDDGIEFFDSLLISKQIQKINQIKDNFDLCLVTSWAAARIAYLTNLNYVMYFVGNDITTPPFVKNPRVPYLNKPVYNLNFFERSFYKRVFNNAILHVAGPGDIDFLNKYSNNVKMIHACVDTELFNENIKPINLPKRKFTFLSAQRISLEKGFDVIWEALNLCKNDFEVLQVEWFIERTAEEKRIKNKLLANVPKQIKFIPLIKRNELARYFMFADAILGQMRSGFLGAIERDAAFCKKPVLCYIDQKKPIKAKNIEIIPPFLPTSQNPSELANLIDKVVTSQEFRNHLIESEYDYVKKISEPQQVVNEWENLFEILSKKYTSINNNSSVIRNKIEKIISLIAEKLIYNRTMREKNIQAWGKDEYERLTK